MAVAARGEDEFGNLFADLQLQDVQALRGFGSLHWSFEDESENYTGAPSREFPPKSPPVTSVHGSYANVTPAHVELAFSSIHCASKKNEQAECENVCKNGTSDASGVALPADDLAADSGDDLHIVLGSLQKTVNEGIADDSEDGEDFDVLTGNEVAGGQEWHENSLMPTEGSAQARAVGEEKVGLSADDQVQSQKASGVSPRIFYGGQTYRRHFRYVRANGISRLGAISNRNARVAKFKSSFARIGGGGGVTNSHRTAGRTGAVRGFSSGPEYILPHNKTVFDIDIDAFKEKPWRLSNVDVSDYFNFNLDESSWKSYCKQLTQFCLEVTTQSKISVYEGGRIGQPTVCEKQAGVGQQISADNEGQQFRDSDAIFLIDVKEDDMPPSCSEGNQAAVRDACKALDSGVGKMNLIAENKVGNLEKELASVERSTRISQKRSSVVLKEFSVNELQEDGSAAAVSRLKTPSPATPPERLPTRGKRVVMTRGKSQNSGRRVGQLDHESGVLCKSKENLQLADYKTSWGGQSLNAASKSTRENPLSRRKDLKRGGIHAIAAQMIKKQRLDSHQANHGCRYASLLIKKLSRVHTTKMISSPKVKADTAQQENELSRINASETFNDRITSGKHLNGPSGEHVTEVVERQEEPISVDNTRSKRKDDASCSEVRDAFQDVLCDSVKEKSRSKLKVKKSKKGHKDKDRGKSKGKVHLPGCPNFKKRLEKNDLMQGMGNISMIGFISNNNKLYWKKVDSLCERDLEDQDAETMSITYQCHKTKQRTEVRSLSEKSESHHLTVGGEGQCKKRMLKEKTYDNIRAETRGYDELLENNVMNSWNALKVLRGKKKNVKQMFIKEMRLASSKAHPLANSACKTRANDSKQGLIEEQVTVMDKRKQFEDRGRDLSFPGQLHLESDCKVQGLTDSALLANGQLHLESDCKVQGLMDSALVANGQRHKKQHSKKSSHKHSCKNSNKLTPSVNQQGEQSNKFNKLKNYGAATTRSRNVGKSLDELDKCRDAALESCQTEPLSTKMERTYGTSRTLLGKRMQKVEQRVRQAKWHCQETKSFWAFSV